MTRAVIESQAAPAAQGPIENRVQDLAAALLVACAATAISDPGVIAGAVFWIGWRWLYRPSLPQRVAAAALFATPLLALHSFIVWAWPWRHWLGSMLPAVASPAASFNAGSAAYTEALLGPLWLEAFALALSLRSRRVDAQVRRDHRLDTRRWRAISSGARAMLDAADSPPHPPGAIRLGVDGDTNAPLDLALPTDLATHVFLPGATGTGKTTTIARLADGALFNGYAVVIVDAKGSGLKRTARDLAARYKVPFLAVDPDDPKSLGYNPCTGDASEVANKIVGAFSYGPTAEFYKNIAMEAVPIVVRGLQAAGEPVTLAALRDAFGIRGTARIAQKIQDNETLVDELLEIGGEGMHSRQPNGGTGGLRYRLGALLQGKFRPLFEAKKFLDWDAVLARPCVVYVSLSALASSEDVELFGRVIAQDLKQVCARRLRRIAAGKDVLPVLSVWDEFAALREAEQLVDFQLQAREALMPTVISTQFVPEVPALRKSCLSAGLLLVHRVEAEDAEAIAAQFGTRPATDVTHQIDYGTGYSEKGSIRKVDKYNVHPNEIRTFETGQVAYKSVPRRKHAVVRVYRTVM
jgi:Helicase HerA, central domain